MTPMSQVSSSSKPWARWRGARPPECQHLLHVALAKSGPTPGVAAAYGSVSAVTFVMAMQYLETAGLFFGGHMAVAMVLMESPAIIMAVLLANTLRHAQTVPTGASHGSGTAVLGAGGGGPSIGRILHDSYTDGAHLLLSAIPDRHPSVHVGSAVRPRMTP